MGMSGKNRVGIVALFLADCVDLAKHFWTAAVVTAASAASWRRCITKRRVMHSQKERARVIFSLNACELRGKVIELSVGNICPFTVFARNHSRVFESVAEQADDPDERRIQREVDSGLRHRSSMQRARLGGDRWL